MRLVVAVEDRAGSRAGDGSCITYAPTRTTKSKLVPLTIAASTSSCGALATHSAW